MANNIRITSPTIYHTIPSSNCPQNLIDNSSYQVLTQMSNRKLGSHHLDLIRSLLPRLPRCHNCLPQNWTHRSNRRHPNVLARGRPVSNIIPPHLRGRNG